MLSGEDIYYIAATLWLNAARALSLDGLLHYLLAPVPVQHQHTDYI